MATRYFNFITCSIYYSTDFTLYWSEVTTYHVSWFINKNQFLHNCYLWRFGCHTIVPSKFLHLDGFFVIDSPCIFCENKAVFVHDIYDLIEFIDGGGIVLRDVKFRTAILKDDIPEIVVYDTDSNQVLHRTHPFNDESVPCDWLLAEKNYFNEDLLEFDFN